MKNKVLAIFVAAAMTGGVLSGCGGNESAQSSSGSNTETTSANSESSASSTSAASSDEESASGEMESYNLIANTFGAGAYPLDEIQYWQNYATELYGCSIDIANNEFVADKVVSQLESQLASNPDGAVYCLQFATTFNPCINYFDDAGIPYVWNSNFPSDEETTQRCLEDELFAGGVNSNAYDQGCQMAEMALADGNKTAVITGAAIGDFNHDNRMAGFTEVFEAGGGKVLQVAHSTDPSEVVQKTNDLLSANPDVDCIYGSGGDYLSGIVTCLDGRTDVNPDMMIYGTDIDPTLIPLVKDGTISGMNGSQGVQGSLAIALLINAIDGHRIVDENGQPIMFDNLESALITPDNADAYIAGYDANVSWVGDENYKNLLYRYNPDVTVDDFNNFFENYAATSLAVAESCL